MINWQNGTTPINATNMNKLVQEDMITNVYSSSSTYAVGDYCIYGNTLYRCTTAISTAEAWNSAKWALVNIADEIKNSMELYSTTERKIGTWIDGKPLYRKVFTAEYNTANTEALVNSNIQNINKIVDIKGFILTSNNAERPLNFYNNISGEVAYLFYNSATNFAFCAPWTGTINAIIEYTKTTD